MPRPSNPNGKDKPRTICLDGDVSEIAQRLADNNMLSREITEFLRNKYGHPTQLDKLKAQLSDMVNARKNLQAQEEELIQAIDEEEALARQKAIHDLENERAVARKNIKEVESNINLIETRLKYGIADDVQRELAKKDLIRYQNALVQLKGVLE